MTVLPPSSLGPLIERRQNRTGALASAAARYGQCSERLSCSCQFGNLAIKGRDAGPSKLAHCRTIVRRLKCQQLLDLLQLKSRRLCPTNEVQALNIGVAIGPHAAGNATYDGAFRL